jgi:hypothetical protein
MAVSLIFSFEICEKEIKKEGIFFIKQGGISLKI